jgi:hypothetical protein
MWGLYMDPFPALCNFIASRAYSRSAHEGKTAIPVSSSNQVYMPHIGLCEVMNLRAMPQSGNKCTLKAARPVIPKIY